jgi:hypothetical protein
MSRRAISRASLVGLVLVVTASCSKPSSPGETQAGAATDANRPPYAGGERATCRDLPSADDLKKWLREAPGVEGEAGGLFSGKMEWGTIVNRQGEICATAVATDHPASAWPGSQAISKAKASTANAYSTDDSPLSTARLYTLTQPGHSLSGVAEPNPFRADWADHEIAKPVRHLAQLDPEKGEFADDIIFTATDGASPFAHPLCANTWRNGQKLGDEAKAAGY